MSEYKRLTCEGCKYSKDGKPCDAICCVRNSWMGLIDCYDPEAEAVLEGIGGEDCETCKKQHTMDCPNSSECYSLKDKPYWQPKE
ncbi:hypothetical protein LPY66_18250 [Dehalobacter sp. DCM]|uniref:hypothetical protein n=1 Tax=Dehalobacter sp. DCM TaxID=2907827 RepID=UPI003081CFD0|nr:hypothetical protein LPY66_18250 [Dehalobacter sp. DCM]